MQTGSVAFSFFDCKVAQITNLLSVSSEIANFASEKSGSVNWLKTYNLRQVQYIAGHKYVSSTERYQANNLENLQNKLEKFHPLNKNF
jgi:hypothetical protein